MLWPHCFHQISDIGPLGAVLHICRTWSPIPLPRRPCRWPGRWRASQSSSTSGGSHLLSPTCAVLRLHLLAMSAHPLRTTASGKSVVNFGFTTSFDSMFFSTSPTFTASWLSAAIHFLSPSIFSEPTFSCEPRTTILTGLSPSSCCFAKRFSALIKVSQTPCGDACAQKNLCISAVQLQFSCCQARR